MRKILTALSGGVDSAVTAALLREQGYDVGGACMILHSGGETEAQAAEAAAERLGLPFHLFRWEEDFQREVIAPFAEVYQTGGTPNPCVLCNKALKFGKFLSEALNLGYDGIATGHYARVENIGERVLLKAARDVAKDQTYVLAVLNQDQLSHTVLPLGGYTKAEVREMAERFGLAEQQGKKDSQDICFVPDGDYMRYLTSRGLTPQEGQFLGPNGETLGPHRGYEGYTIGQRRGLGIAAGRRVYVVSKPRPNVVLGEEEALYTTRVRLSGMNWIPWDTPPGSLRAMAKLRYTAKPASCAAVPDGNGAELVFDVPQRAVTPGQTAVLYDGETVLGAGTIEDTVF